MQLPVEAQLTAGSSAHLHNMTYWQSDASGHMKLPAYRLSRDSLPGSGQADWGWGCRHRRPSCTTVSEPYCSARKPDCRTRILHRLTMLLRRTSTRARACRRRWPSYAARLRAPWKLPMRSNPSWPQKRLRRVLHGAAEIGMLSGPAPGRPSAGYAPTSRMVPALGTTCRFSLSKGQVCFVSTPGFRVSWVEAGMRSGSACGPLSAGHPACHLMVHVLPA